AVCCSCYRCLCSRLGPVVHGSSPTQRVCSACPTCCRQQCRCCHRPYGCQERRPRDPRRLRGSPACASLCRSPKQRCCCDHCDALCLRRTHSRLQERGPSRCDSCLHPDPCWNQSRCGGDLGNSCPSKVHSRKLRRANTARCCTSVVSCRCQDYADTDPNSCCQDTRLPSSRQPRFDQRCCGCSCPAGFGVWSRCECSRCCFYCCAGCLVVLNEPVWVVCALPVFSSIRGVRV
ncbi:hypothetical protein BC830DRAFT_1216627, partial [Chytriomyces sp. MP71]